jgi:ketosteroid isomerase-like protein
MNRAPLFLVLGVTVAPMPTVLTFAQSPRDRSTADITRLEQLWDEAHQRGDAQTLEKLWADDLAVAVPRMPPMSKSESLAFARSGRMTFQQ